MGIDRVDNRTADEMLQKLATLPLAFSPGTGPLAPFIGGWQWAGLANWSAVMRATNAQRTGTL